ncbi:MAG: DUF1385 domain-containing protein, partial [Solirubrobacteraceae bacterium]
MERSPRSPRSVAAGRDRTVTPVEHQPVDAPDPGRIDTSYAAQRDAPVGGQAVVEGVMMRGVRHWAIAVRRPLPEQLVDGSLPMGEPAMGHIETLVVPFRSVLARRRLLRAPVIRGSVALVESLRIGFRALRLAADAQQGPEAPPVSRREWAFAVFAGVSLALVLFVLTPVGLTSLIKDQLGSGVAFWTVEAIVSTTIFVLYLTLISRLPDLRRVFEYHG